MIIKNIRDTLIQFCKDNNIAFTLDNNSELEIISYLGISILWIDPNNNALINYYENITDTYTKKKTIQLADPDLFQILKQSMLNHKRKSRVETLSPQ